jgi:hypothetical protein
MCKLYLRFLIVVLSSPPWRDSNLKTIKRNPSEIKEIGRFFDKMRESEKVQ